jgi:hypothetical protein
MKTNRIILALCSLFFVLAACDDTTQDEPASHWVNDVLYPPNAQVKRTLKVYPDQTTSLFSEYEYDASGRIQCVFFPSRDSHTMYNLYAYNAEGLLERISHCDNPATTRQVVHYTYNANGDKVKETTHYPEAATSDSILYHYEGRRLVKSEHFRQGAYSYYVLYAYNAAGERVKETLHVPGEAEFVTTEYTFAEGLQVKSVTYDGSIEHFMWGQELFYDRNRNLIIQRNNTPGLSSTYPQPATFYDITRYEY